MALPGSLWLLLTCGSLAFPPSGSSGWVQDGSGKWVKDENVEFDSDEEDPPPWAPS